jgi:hypothetical protein
VDARRDLKKRGERLEIRGAKLTDSGNYSCVAIAADGERDTVHFDLVPILHMKPFRPNLKKCRLQVCKYSAEKSEAFACSRRCGHPG